MAYNIWQFNLTDKFRVCFFASGKNWRRHVPVNMFPHNFRAIYCVRDMAHMFLIYMVPIRTDNADIFSLVCRRSMSVHAIGCAGVQAISKKMLEQFPLTAPVAPAAVFSSAVFQFGSSAVFSSPVFSSPVRQSSVRQSFSSAVLTSDEYHFWRVHVRSGTRQK